MNKRQAIRELQEQVSLLKDTVQLYSSVVTTLESAGILNLIFQVGKTRVYSVPNREFNEFKRDIEQYLGIEKISDPPRYRKKD